MWPFLISSAHCFWKLYDQMNSYRYYFKICIINFSQTFIAFGIEFHVGLPKRYWICFEPVDRKVIYRYVYSPWSVFFLFCFFFHNELWIQQNLVNHWQFMNTFHNMTIYEIPVDKLIHSHSMQNFESKETEYVVHRLILPFFLRVN